MRAILAVLALLAFAACDGGTPGPNGPNGPLKLGIVSGNHQVTTAGAERLGAPVVGKMVRTASGSVAFHLVTPAYAQDGTTVTGSPVAGAVVCAVSVTDAGLTPFTPCTNTGEDGTATFFFTPGTKAGEAKSEIRGTVDSTPAVFDTVVATVAHGVAAGGEWMANCQGIAIEFSDTFDLSDSYGVKPVQDQYGNAIEPWLLRRFAGSTKYTIGTDSQTVIATPDSSGIDSLQVIADGTAVRTAHVYVHHPAIAPTKVLIFNWNAEHTCGGIGNIPKP